MVVKFVISTSAWPFLNMIFLSPSVVCVHMFKVPVDYVEVEHYEYKFYCASADCNPVCTSYRVFDSGH